jgi:hypothetical protein
MSDKGRFSQKGRFLLDNQQKTGYIISVPEKEPAT